MLPVDRGVEEEEVEVMLSEVEETVDSEVEDVEPAEVEPDSVELASVVEAAPAKQLLSAVADSYKQPALLKRETIGTYNYWQQ